MEEEMLNAGAKNEPVGGETKTFDEFLKENKEFQAEFDRRLQKGNLTAVENAKKQWIEEQDNQKSEAEKLASMNEKQKHEYELKKALSERDEARAINNAYLLKEQAEKIASDKGVDASLLSFIDFRRTSAEDLEGKIDKLSSAFNKAVENGINTRLKEKAPITKTDNTTGKTQHVIPKMF